MRASASCEVSSAGYPSAYYLNAMANLRLGHLDAAEKSAREAIRLDSAHRNPRTGYVLGLVLAEKQEYGQAADLLKAYLRATPNAPDSGTVGRQLSNIKELAKSHGTPAGADPVEDLKSSLRKPFDLLDVHYVVNFYALWWSVGKVLRVVQKF